MKTKFVNFLFLIVFSMPLASVSFAAENAFGSLPSVNNESSQPQSPTSSYTFETIDKTIHPLLQSATTSNTIIGIMISPSLKTAYLRTESGEDYFVKVGDRLGNAKGTITDINSEGIEVTEDSKVISLPVRNRSVSNEDAK
jgi:hypothetical protein